MMCNFSLSGNLNKCRNEAVRARAEVHWRYSYDHYDHEFASKCVSEQSQETRDTPCVNVFSGHEIIT